MTDSKPHSSKKYPTPPKAEVSEATLIPLDMSGLDQILDQTKLTLEDTGGQAQPESSTDPAQELIKRMEAFEAVQTAMAARLEQMEGLVRRDTRAVIVEMMNLRNDLLGERKALSSLSVFNSVVQTMDSLTTMRTSLSGEADSALCRQVDAVIASLTLTLRGLGFIQFNVDRGETFDPLRMECTGYAQGLPGVVLDITRVGYRTEVGIARPAGVLIADPTPSTDSH